MGSLKDVKREEEDERLLGPAPPQVALASILQDSTFPQYLTTGGLRNRQGGRNLIGAYCSQIKGEVGQDPRQARTSKCPSVALSCPPGALCGPLGHCSEGKLRGRALLGPTG